MKTITLQRFLLVALVCTSLFQAANGQQVPKLLAISEYHFDEAKNAMRITDSIWYYRPTLQPYDPVLQYWPFDIKLRKYAGNNFQDGDTTYYSFDNNHNITKETFIETYGGDVDTMQEKIYSYNSRNLKIFEQRSQRFSDTLWAMWQMYFDYDGLNNLTSEVYDFRHFGTQTWNHQDSNVYIYSGNVKTEAQFYRWQQGGSSGPGYWSLEYFRRYTYQNGRLDTTYLYDGYSILDRIAVEHYDAQGNRDTTTSYDYLTGDDRYENEDRSFFTYDTSHNQLTETYQKWQDTAWENSYSDTFTYTSYHLPRSVLKNLIWDEASQQFVPFYDGWNPQFSTIQQIFYYDADTATNVAPLHAASHSLKVYPNPASQQMNIEITGNGNRSFEVVIHDAMGKAILHWIEPAATRLHKAVDVSRWPTGNYLILTSGESPAYQQFTIVH